MTAWTRVSVAGPESSIDVGLPADLPITDFLDELVVRVAGPPEVADAALEWTLSPIGRDRLAPHETLRGAGVDDGTWLVLREGPAEDPAVLIDDTLDALTELNDARHGSWSPRAAARAGALTAVCSTVIGAAGLITARCSASPATRVVVAAVAVAGALALLGAALHGARSAARAAPGNRPDNAVPIGLALCAMAAAMAAAAGFALVPGHPGAAHVLLATATTSTCAALTLRTTRVAPTGHIAVITAACFAGCAAAASLAGLDRAGTAALIGVAAVLLVLAAPRLTVVLAKIPLPPVPSPGEPIDAIEAPLLPSVEAVDALSLRALPDITALTRRAEQARQFLTGLCLGAAVAAVGADIAAGVRPPDWRFTALALGAGFALVLRGRSHTDLAQAVTLIGGGTAAVLGFLAAAIGADVVGGSSRPLTAAIAALAVAALALVLGGWAAGRTFSPIQRRAAELAEYALLVVLVPLLLWVLEVYRIIREAW